MQLRYAMRFESHWEIKGRFRERVVLANIPSFRFSLRGTCERTLIPVFVRGNIRMYPRSGFRSGGRSAKSTLLETTLLSTPENRTSPSPSQGQILAVWILAMQLPNSDPYFAVDFLLVFLFPKNKAPKSSPRNSPETGQNSHLQAMRNSFKLAMQKPLIGERLRGKWIGATGLRASEREICLSEDLWEGLWEGEVFRGLRFFRGFQRSSQRHSQRQISLSEALSPVAPNRVALELSPTLACSEITRKWHENSGENLAMLVCDAKCRHVFNIKRYEMPAIRTLAAVWPAMRAPAMSNR